MTRPVCDIRHSLGIENMHIPIQTSLPRLDLLSVEWKGRQVQLPYLYREGAGGPSILFVHGLGGAKENFYAAFQSPSLADCTIATFDQPGTGLAAFDPDAGLDVSALADMTQSVADQLLPGPYFLAGASMGGLITLLQLRRYGIGRIEGCVNLEGNLASEDCMFSRRVVDHDLDSFGPVFRQTIDEMRAARYSGDRVIAHNLALNVDIRGYHAYSFETVDESDSGRLLDEFLALPVPRLFLYGEENKGLSYLPRLRASEVRVREIPLSAHFIFYDNPVETFQAIGEFVHTPHSSSAAGNGMDFS
jgi:pimeloyl-ACP methyl ester carboxylesterase